MPRVSIEFDVSDDQVQPLLSLLGVGVTVAKEAADEGRDYEPPKPGSSPRDFFHHYDEDAKEPARDVPELARRFKLHLGSPTWQMLVASAKHFPDVFFTVEGLAEALGTDVGNVRKRMRALGRSRVLKDMEGLMDADTPADTHPWIKIWDGQRNIYCFQHPDWPAAIVNLEAERGDR